MTANAAKDRFETWSPDVTYVIGHQRPDTDAIASALGYAWYLSQTGHSNVQSARCGQPNEQAQYALKRFEAAAPRLLAGVAPTFHHAAIAQPTVKPNDPLPAAMMRVAEGDRVIPIVGTDGKPSGVVTSLALARAYTAPVNVTVMLLQPVQNIAEQPLLFSERDRISDHRNMILRSETDDFVIVTEEGNYVGVATRRKVLDPPRARLILVDHNELGQAVTDAEEAEIIGVLDHHRLGNAPTALPIPFVIEPVGSTSTLVAEHCLKAKLMPPIPIAGMLLSGILSDTLVFRSPTTTDRDQEVAKWLAEIAGVSMFSYGEDLLRASPGLSARGAEEILDTDRKTYYMGGNSVSVGQVEVTGFQELPDQREALLAALEARRQKEGLALIGLMITDIVTGRSHLLAQGDNWILTALPFTRIADHEYDLEDMVSRKKQLVPTLHAVLEESR
jgi:manganese-dependent inorganic pyrophosphatase